LPRSKIRPALSDDTMVMPFRSGVSEWRGVPALCGARAGRARDLVGRDGSYCGKASPIACLYVRSGNAAMVLRLIEDDDTSATLCRRRRAPATSARGSPT
jgi:hypothetical protein